jgi:hypothetical protein
MIDIMKLSNVEKIFKSEYEITFQEKLNVEIKDIKLIDSDNWNQDLRLPTKANGTYTIVNTDLTKAVYRLTLDNQDEYYLNLLKHEFYSDHFKNRLDISIDLYI